MSPRLKADVAPRPRTPQLSQRPSTVAILGLAVFLTVGCFDQVTAPDTESDGRVTVINDDDVLAERLTYTDEEILIDPPAPAELNGSAVAMTDGPALAPSAVDLTLIAQLDPPTVNGEVVQATSISRRNNNGFLVSYNARGDAFLGGIDYIREWQGRFPRVRSSVRFGDADVSAVALSGSAVYAAVGTNDVTYATPASVERLRVSDSRMRLAENSRQDLSSFTATSVQVTDDAVYVTTGDDGALYALDPGTLAVLGRYALDDARWVEYDEEGDRIVVVQGTPGRISIFEAGAFPGGSMVLLDSFTFPGADVPESKSAMDIAGGKAFIAAGPSGVQVMCLDDGQIVGSVPRPDPEALGLDPSVVVTNAVTVDDDLMFISNGEAGVYVAAGAEEWDDTDCDEPQSINVLGQLRFSDLQSANHVDYRRGYLFVAAGLGGVKVVEVDITP